MRNATPSVGGRGIVHLREPDDDDADTAAEFEDAWRAAVPPDPDRTP
ncbi:hypothetical protein Aph02nite_90340 [Actinoplanes philippinensis]|uniref:Uncharacterized protein n=1 Tax=Actinoplanes philippinensis TaxID=35752 RepID=A0A1I2M715_9ACTN|nr:hypothetical protein [Actinoplanes philippinensis]GIE83084.1 hypothetical protein Aph02nite_90340 [Actinoplanes philippinensis]SFF87283.1 hypothetical protein SAMN05421541_12724 [Actinoplanes philippinensis]